MNSRVSTCHITTCYYIGFAYMMMRRYQDAIRTLTNILLFIQRTKQLFQNKTYLYDQVGMHTFIPGQLERLTIVGGRFCNVF